MEEQERKMKQTRCPQIQRSPLGSISGIYFWKDGQRRDQQQRCPPNSSPAHTFWVYIAPGCPVEKWQWLGIHPEQCPRASG